MQFYIYNMAIVMIYVAEIFRARFLQMFAFYVRALSVGGGGGGGAIEAIEWAIFVFNPAKFNFNLHPIKRQTKVFELWP